MDLQQVLRDQVLFRPLTDEELARLSRGVTVKSFKEGETILRYEAPATHVYLTLRGTVHLMLPAMSRDFSLLVSKVRPGELFGVAPVVGGERYTALAMAIEPVEVLCIEAPLLVEILKSNHAAGYHVIRDVARVYMARYTEVMRNMQAMISHIPLSR